MVDKKRENQNPKDKAKQTIQIPTEEGQTMIFKEKNYRKLKIHDPSAWTRLNCGGGVHPEI